MEGLHELGQDLVDLKTQLSGGCKHDCFVEKQSA